MGRSHHFFIGIVCEKPCPATVGLLLFPEPSHGLPGFADKNRLLLSPGFSLKCVGFRGITWTGPLFLGAR